MAFEENKALARRFIEGFSTGDLSHVDDFIAPDFDLRGPGTPPVTGKGPDRYRQTIQAYRNAFRDIRITIDDEIAEGDKVAVSWHAEGTMEGELLGIPPTGKRGHTSVVHIFQIRDGMIRDARIEWDMLGLLQQMGVSPAPGQSQRRAA